MVQKSEMASVLEKGRNSIYMHLVPIPLHPLILEDLRIPLLSKEIPNKEVLPAAHFGNKIIETFFKIKAYTNFIFIFNDGKVARFSKNYLSQ